MIKCKKRKLNLFTLSCHQRALRLGFNLCLLDSQLQSSNLQLWGAPSGSVAPCTAQGNGRVITQAFGLTLSPDVQPQARPSCPWASIFWFTGWAVQDEADERGGVGGGQFLFLCGCGRLGDRAGSQSSHHLWENSFETWMSLNSMSVERCSNLHLQLEPVVSIKIKHTSQESSGGQSSRLVQHPPYFCLCR